jgi:dTMP kinase
MMAVFVAFEGVEGSGKTTQIGKLHERMLANRLSVILAREPGATALGDYLRTWLKQSPTTPHAELFLFCAARSQFVSEIVRPSLAGNIHVITDRYSASTIAYQGHGRSLGQELVMPVVKMAEQDVTPDLYVLMDIDPQLSLSRIVIAGNQGSSNARGKQGAQGRVDVEGQRFEEEPLAFHKRVRQGYLGLAKASRDSWLVLDATKPSQELSDLIWERVQALLSI